MAGVTRQGIASIIDQPDFPPPICLIGKNEAPLFYRREVQAFLDRRTAAKARAKAATPAAA